MGCTSSLPKNSKFISEDVLEEVVGSYRDAPPAHYLYKIDSFSCLTNPLISPSFRRLKTTDFEIGGYKWKLSLYPHGDMNKNVKDHMSVYLEICGTSSMPVGWEVNVVFRFFLLDQIRDKYLMLGGKCMLTNSFIILEEERNDFMKCMKKEMGFSKLIPIATFSNPSNGYLLNDKCVFGAEVLLVPRSTGCGEHLSMVKEKTSTKTFQWAIQNFSQRKEEFIYSGALIVGNFEWNIKIYPKGLPEGRNKSISLYLRLADSTNFNNTLKVYTQFKLAVQIQTPSGIVVFSGFAHEAKYWFCASSQECGWKEFMELDVLTGQDNCYLVNDTFIVEAEITVMGFLQKLP